MHGICALSLTADLSFLEHWAQGLSQAMNTVSCRYAEIKFVTPETMLFAGKKWLRAGAKIAPVVQRPMYLLAKTPEKQRAL
jgi:hypothetical protein